MLAIYLKDTSAVILPLSLQAQMCMIIGQYVLPSAENVNITVMFYAYFPFSAENTFLAPWLPELFL
jgi:hypothetical protein